MDFAQRFERVLSGDTQGDIVCGDCLDVMAQMPDECVDLAICDAPYFLGKDFGLYFNVHYIGKWLKGLDRILKRTASLYVFMSKELVGYVQVNLDRRLRYCFRNFIAWNYETSQLTSSKKYKSIWEPILYYSVSDDYVFNLDAIRIPRKSKMRGKVPYKTDGMNPGDVWTMQRAWGSEHLPHPTQKPMAVIERMIEASSNKGNLIFDPFIGSGTTAVAADRLGRSFFGCDINPDYVKMSLDRISQDRLKRSQLALL